MTSILLVEDSDDKARLVGEAIAAVSAAAARGVERRATIVDAFAAMQQRHYDVLILDLQVPMRAGEEPAQDGGLRLLDLLQRGRANYPDHVVGLTAYDELVALHETHFRSELMYLVKYDRSSNTWSDAIGRKILAVERSKAPSSDGGYDYDVAVITALHRVEMEAVLAWPVAWTELTAAGDDSVYHRAEVARDGGHRPLRVVAAAALDMGMPAATALAMKMAITFRPRYLAMAGIAAGVGCGPGDILVADSAWDYGSGKYRETGDGAREFLPAPTHVSVHPRLRARLVEFASRDQVRRDIQARWPGAWLQHQLEVKVGPIGSGAAVIDSAVMVEEVKGQHRKVIGIEMETFGVFTAARACPAPRPQVLSIKSVSDFGAQKTDDYQRLAAFTSAQFLLEFLRHGLEVPE